MLTRLRVRNFKNLVDADIRFGPLTCIAGPNGVGKSNLFDAIAFLAAAAERPLLDAAMSVRDDSGKTGDVRSLFHRIGEDYASQISFEAEMIVPGSGIDDLGRQAAATTTFLRYKLVVAYRNEDPVQSRGGLELIEEELSHILQKQAPKHLLFRPSREWVKSAVKSSRRGAPFISTSAREERQVHLHLDGGTGGKPRPYSAARMPRTILSAVNSAEAPTATLAKKEMQSWRLLQLEPSCLRRPDAFDTPDRLGADGSHLAHTLYRLAHPPGANGDRGRSGHVYAQLALRLSELIDDVRSVDVDRDETRRLYSLTVRGRDGTRHPARALSDGTLRFLALAALELDSESTGVLCLEEPENGIHPARIPAMLDLLRDIAADTSEEVGSGNPLRQVIINTHSPQVVALSDVKDLVFAEARESIRPDDGKRYQAAVFSCPPGTWRARAEGQPVTPVGRMLQYLNPYPAGAEGSRRGVPMGSDTLIAKFGKQLDFPFVDDSSACKG